MGSNGLTSARHDVFAKSLAAKYAESYDPALPEALVRASQHSLRRTARPAANNRLSPLRTRAASIGVLRQVPTDGHRARNGRDGALMALVAFAFLMSLL